MHIRSVDSNTTCGWLPILVGSLALFDLASLGDEDGGYMWSDSRGVFWERDHRILWSTVPPTCGGTDTSYNFELWTETRSHSEQFTCNVQDSQTGHFEAYETTNVVVGGPMLGVPQSGCLRTCALLEQARGFEQLMFPDYAGEYVHPH